MPQRAYLCVWVRTPLRTRAKALRSRAPRADDEQEARVQITMTQRLRAAAIALIAGAAVFVAGAAAGYAVLRGESDETDAVTLPTACDNFLAASTLFARDGASAAIPVTGADPLALDAEAQAYETLRGLLDSCGRELALRVK
jgi:hypothetical protein